MSKGPSIKSSSQEIAALGGPTHLVTSFQTKLIARLSTILERRQIIKGHLGATDEEAEKEINRICSSFAKEIELDLKQLVLEAYGYKRFVKVVPGDTWEKPLNAGLTIKETLPYGKQVTASEELKSAQEKATVTVMKEEELTEPFDDFSELFGVKKIK